MSYLISSCTVWPSSAWPPNAQRSSCSLMILCYYTSMESLSPLTKACFFFRLQLHRSILSENFSKSLHIPIFCPSLRSYFILFLLLWFLFCTQCLVSFSTSLPRETVSEIQGPCIKHFWYPHQYFMWIFADSLGK